MILGYHLFPLLWSVYVSVYCWFVLSLIILIILVLFIEYAFEIIWKQNTFTWGAKHDKTHKPESTKINAKFRIES